MHESSSITQHTVSALASQCEAFLIFDIPHKAYDVCEVSVIKIKNINVIVYFIFYFLILTMVKKDFTSFTW